MYPISPLLIFLFLLPPVPLLFSLLQKEKDDERNFRLEKEYEGKYGEAKSRN